MTDHNFIELRDRLTEQVVSDIYAVGSEGAVIAEAPPGAGKSTLTVSVAQRLINDDPDLTLAIVTQTNEQADDLVGSLCKAGSGPHVARMTSQAGPSKQILSHSSSGLTVGGRCDELSESRIIVSTARKWQFERSRLQKNETQSPCRIALIDEAYQMRSDALLGVADLFSTLFCVGDPGQLDPFSSIDDTLWKGLDYSPSRAALSTLRAYHQDIEPIQLPLSWRLPPSAIPIISDAFYPFTPFEAGTQVGDRRAELGKAVLSPLQNHDPNAYLDQASQSGWSYVELPQRYTFRTDSEIAQVLAAQVYVLLKRGVHLRDELKPEGVVLTRDRVAVIAAHNDQVHAVRYHLSQLGLDPNEVLVSTANKIQGREYDFVFVWHPLAGRRDASAFHLESGRMCVMLSRHRHGCVVVGRAGSRELLEEYPDSDPVYINEAEKFPDGWEANHKVLSHLEKCMP